MCTSTYGSPATPRRPALKRRRLSHALDAGCQPGRAPTDNSNAAPTPNPGPSLALSAAKLSCSTCHRTLSTAVRPSVAALFMCSRCAAPTCAICARTCTSYTRPASFPPTPALTRSPSPSPSPSTASPPAVSSPKRTALGLSYAAMNGDAHLVATTKRKKPPIDKEDGGAARDHGHPDPACASAHGVRDGAEATVVPGCGRTVCRACCVEGIPSDGKLCVDCFALV